MNAEASPQARVRSLDAMRGFAALSVALFHFVGPPNREPAPAVLAELARAGWAGVEAFFVISGFAMSWILLHSREPATAASASRFIGRRLVRLMPPYLVCCVLVILLQFASSMTPGFRGAPFVFPSMEQMACHVIYACDALSVPWLNPVFWTLAIEVQFYVVAAALFLFAARSRPAFLYALLGTLVLASPMADGNSLLRYAPHFTLGATMARQLQVRPNHGFFLLAGACCVVVTAWTWGLVEALVLAVTAAACLVPWQPTRWMLWLGSISYSVYLVHLPIGGRVVNLLERFEPTAWGWTAAAIAATSATLIASSCMYRLVEKPSIALSRRWLSTRVSGAAPVAAMQPGG